MDTLFAISYFVFISYFLLFSLDYKFSILHWWQSHMTSQWAIPDPTYESLFSEFIFLYHMSYQIGFAQKNRKTYYYKKEEI